MATVLWTVDTKTPRFGTLAKGLSAVLAAGDQTVAMEDGGFADRTVQVEGTFNGTTITLEGSNDATLDDGSDGTWHTLLDSNGNACSFTASALVQVGQITKRTRVKATGGTATALRVNVFMRQNAGNS